MSIRKSSVRLCTTAMLIGLGTARVCLAADTAVVVWDDALLQGVRDNPPGPTIVARALAVLHTAMFDAWAAYDATAVPTIPSRGWRRLAAEATDANKLKAVCFAAYRAAVDLFPIEKARYDALLRNQGYDSSDASLDPSTPSGVGNLAAAAVLDLRHKDGSNQLGDLHTGAYSDYTGYQPVNSPTSVVDPNRWQPLLVNNQTQVYTTPHWGNVIPFALPSGSALRPGPPATYPSQAYTDQANEIIAISAGLNDVQKVTAEYFADGPNSEFPPGHWVLFAQFVSRRDGHSLDDDVKMFFALGNAMLDASICAWDAKRAYDSERPGTAIHFLFAGQMITAWGGPFQGTKSIRGEDWQPYQLSTVPDSPVSRVLFRPQHLFRRGSRDPEDLHGQRRLRQLGDDQSEKLRRGAGRRSDQRRHALLADFSDAADAAGMSRRYGGIHFAQGDLTGRALGRQIGAMVWAKAKTYFDGTAGRSEIVPKVHPHPPARTLPR